MLDEVGPARTIRVDQRPDDAITGILARVVLRPARLRAIGDNPFDIPFARVEKKADQGLFIVRIAARVGFDQKAKTFFGVQRGCAAQEAKSEKQKKKESPMAMPFTW